jgi:hypothetical protein
LALRYGLFLFFCLDSTYVIVYIYEREKDIEDGGGGVS